MLKSKRYLNFLPYLKEKRESINRSHNSEHHISQSICRYPMLK